MSKPATKQHPAADLASEAVDAIHYGKNSSRWLSALMRSIQLDAKHNQSRNVGDLASLGQYLGDDCAGYLDSEYERLRRDLDTVEG